MKIRLKCGDIVLEYERKPMKKERFYALLLLAAAALYVCLVLGIVYLNSAFSAGVIAIITLGSLMILSAIRNGF